MLENYLEICKNEYCDKKFTNELEEIILHFKSWQHEHPEKTKKPD